MRGECILLALTFFALLFPSGHSVKRLILGGNTISQENAEIWERFFKTASMLANSEGQCISYKNLEDQATEMIRSFSGDEIYSSLSEDEAYFYLQSSMKRERERRIREMNNSDGRIAIITSGMMDPEGEAKKIQGFWSERYGVKNTVWIPLTPDNPETAQEKKWLSEIESVQGVFIAGQNVTTVIETLLETPLLKMIGDRMEMGCIVMMTLGEATKAVQMTPVIIQGRSHQGFLEKPAEDYEFESPDSPRYRLAGGLGFYQFSFLDLQPASKGLQMLLFSVMFHLAEEGFDNLGMGITDETAFELHIIDTTVIGHGGVYMISIPSPELKEAYFSFLRSGDGFTFITRQLDVSEEKEILKENENLADSLLPKSTNIFSHPGAEISEQNTFEAVILNLAMVSSESSTFGTTFESPELLIKFTKDKKDFVAWHEKKESKEEKAKTVGFGGIRVTYQPSQPPSGENLNGCPLKDSQENEVLIKNKEFETLREDL